VKRTEDDDDSFHLRFESTHVRVKPMATGPVNILRDVPAELPEELVETLLAAPAIRVERIVSRGHASPEGFWYDQPGHEWVLLVAGAARLRFADEAGTTELRPGDCVHIQARRRHRVEWTSADEDTVWLAIHYG
jgi:cupin 2 domain-containing protein